MVEWKFDLLCLLLHKPSLTRSSEINKQRFGYEIKVRLARKKYLHISCEQRQVSVCLNVVICFKYLNLIQCSILLDLGVKTLQALNYFKGK